jgi:hypothetical protein
MGVSWIIIDEVAGDILYRKINKLSRHRFNLNNFYFYFKIVSIKYERGFYQEEMEMKTIRLTILLLIMLGFLVPLAPAATLEYTSGSFAVTPFLYGKISADLGQANSSILQVYNPGPSFGVQTLSGSKDMNISSDGLSIVQGHVSWNLQATYGKTFTLKIEAYNWLNQIMAHSENRSSLKVDSQDGLFLQVMPGAGEKFGQPVKLYLNYDVLTARNFNRDNDPSNLRIESAYSQPTRISVNGVPQDVFPLIQLRNYCSSEHCVPWPSDYSPVQFRSMSYDGPWPYQHECWQTGTNIEAGPGQLISCPDWPVQYLMFDHPITCQIGDVIGLNIGFIQEILDARSDLGGYPGIDTDISFSLKPQVIPVPGSTFLLGTGLLLLTICTRGR